MLRVVSCNFRRSARFACRGTLCGAAILFAVTQPVAAQQEYNGEPINYATAKMNDPVARLQARIDDGKVTLRFDEQHGYLKSVLKELDVSTATQMLVFSKTSFQQRRISRRAPRALYFNDDVYVGWVQRGDVVELSAVDPDRGAVFYALPQKETAHPKFIRDRGNCLVCHASSRTYGVPGHLVRSVFPGPNGMPNFGSGTFRTNHTSPLKQRWGGWYVTGTHGKQRHMGNVVTRDRASRESLNVEAGANITSLDEVVDTSPYVTSHSDIVALMVFEHQTDMQNLITYANYQCKLALQNAEVMNRVLERPDGFVSESTQRRINNAAEKLLRYTLFVDEATLTDELKGTTDFAANFAKIGSKDKSGRSLRQFDLQRRLFKYPCSYLIDSNAFHALPDQLKSRMYRRLWEVLTGEDQSEQFAHLSTVDRRAILGILRETHRGLPEYWQTKKNASAVPSR